MKDGNFTKCQKKCSPFYFLNDLFPPCGWEADDYDDYINAFNAIIDYWYDFKISHGYKKPCRVLEYQSEKIYDEARNETIISYQFAPPMMTNVQQEYLIFDLVGMIGSVGGTLGMFIGFSFSGVTYTILEYFEARIQRLF